MLLQNSKQITQTIITLAYLHPTNISETFSLKLSKYVLHAITKRAIPGNYSFIH